MIVIVNKLLPPVGFTTITLFGVVFARKSVWDKTSSLQKDIHLNHASIHAAQQKELLWVFFFVAYFVEWLILLVWYRDSYKAYQNVSFEKEAARYELSFFYADTRKPFAQWRRR